MLLNTTSNYYVGSTILNRLDTHSNPCYNVFSEREVFTSMTKLIVTNLEHDQFGAIQAVQLGQFSPNGAMRACATIPVVLLPTEVAEKLVKGMQINAGFEFSFRFGNKEKGDSNSFLFGATEYSSVQLNMIGQIPPPVSYFHSS